ncbi:MAG TPA: hypothetical protein VG367_11590 [Mucilaginibacter sp.]|jgi:hypothetical protein|nr:hypothetical protein [Mucilaginibacter sp.]
MADIKFKYNPFSVIAFAVIALVLLSGASYFVIDLILTGEYRVFAVAMILWSVCGMFTYYVFSFVRKMVQGIPAILLTDDFLVLAIPDLRISYDDIDDVAVRAGGKNTILGINVTDPGKYFTTPIKKLMKFSFIAPQNLNINLNLISGNNETIAQSINDYRDKYASSKH